MVAVCSSDRANSISACEIHAHVLSADCKLNESKRAILIRIGIYHNHSKQTSSRIDHKWQCEILCLRKVMTAKCTYRCVAWVSARHRFQFRTVRNECDKKTTTQIPNTNWLMCLHANLCNFTTVWHILAVRENFLSQQLKNMILITCL